MNSDFKRIKNSEDQNQENKREQEVKEQGKERGEKRVRKMGGGESAWLRRFNHEPYQYAAFPANLVASTGAEHLSSPKDL